MYEYFYAHMVSISIMTNSCTVLNILQLIYDYILEFL